VTKYSYWASIGTSQNSARQAATGGMRRWVSNALRSSLLRLSSVALLYLTRPPATTAATKTPEVAALKKFERTVSASSAHERATFQYLRGALR
jgi:hypothetical protein